MYNVDVQGLIITDIILFFASAPAAIFVLKCLLKAYAPGSRGLLHAYFTIALSYLFSIGILLLLFYARLSWYRDINTQMEEANAHVEQLEADNRYNERIAHEDRR